MQPLFLSNEQNTTQTRMIFDKDTKKNGSHKQPVFSEHKKSVVCQIKIWR